MAVSLLACVVTVMVMGAMTVVTVMTRMAMLRLNRLSRLRLDGSYRSLGRFGLGWNGSGSNMVNDFRFRRCHNGGSSNRHGQRFDRVSLDGCAGRTGGHGCRGLGKG
jgi:hypothetical protein